MNERESRPDTLKAFLAERDVPCPLCGYNLRALTTGKCPECGSEVEVTVGLKEPRMAAFIAGVAGLAAGVGFDVLMLCFIGWTTALRGWVPPPVLATGVLVFSLLVVGVALGFWVSRRRAIRRMPKKRQWVLATACYILSGGMAVLFFTMAGR